MLSGQDRPLQRLRQAGLQRNHGVQDTIAQTNENVVMVSRAFAEMKERGLMKDDFHYFQEAYNIVGREAGENTANDVLFRAQS